MKRIFLAVTLGFGLLATVAVAQKPELPADFVFKNQAAEKSSWTIACAYDGDAGDAQAKQEAYAAAMRRMAEGNPEMTGFLAANPRFGTLKPRVEKIVVTKVGKTRREEIFYAGGKKEERWDIPSAYVQKDPFTGQVFLERSGEQDALGDFPECAWIAGRNFRGVEKIAGREALVFESREQRLSLEDPRLYRRSQGSDDEDAVVTVRAALDPQTLLPLTVSWDGQTRTYERGAAPSQPLTLPSDLAAAVEKSNQRTARALRPLSPP